MLAVVRTGGKQYKVKEGDVISVEKLLDEGAKVELSDVLMIDNDGKVKVGTPNVEGAMVTASILKQKKQKTVYVFKKHRRKNYRRKNGHRQVVSILKIEAIKG
ncbi:MAG: 50S ribosomal protein L21 [Alphaproteobacteria bacterium]|nr:50S ribosomal protein L21 [Alphaproteobacteria bacterium]